MLIECVVECVKKYMCVDNGVREMTTDQILIRSALIRTCWQGRLQRNREGV